jgi:hypothetical protein
MSRLTEVPLNRPGGNGKRHHGPRSQRERGPVHVLTNFLSDDLAGSAYRGLVATAEQDVAPECPHVWQLVGVAFVPGHGAPTEYECALGCGSVMYRAAGEPFPPTNWSRHPAPVERHGRSQT